MNIIDGKPIFDTPEEEQQFNALERYNFLKINDYIINGKNPTKEGSDFTIDDVIKTLQKIKDDPNKIITKITCGLSFLNLEKMNGGIE